MVKFELIRRNPNWWRRRTTLERCLTLVSALACVAVIGLVGGLVFVLLTNKMAEELKTSATASNALGLQGSKSSASPTNLPEDTNDFSNECNLETVCLTPECIHTASAVLSKMKPEVEPCDDFYQFACGTYIEETPLPEDKTAVNTFSLISDKLEEQLKEIIVKERLESEPKHFKLPGLLYKACMNKTLIESLGVEPMKEISDSLGGWPVIEGDSWDSNDTWTWQETVKHFRHLGFSMDYVIDFSISVDLKNSSKRIIDFDQSSIGLSREYLVKGLNETLVSAYYDYMVDIAVLFGAERERAKKELMESLLFEISLANISLPNEERRNSSRLYNLITVRKMQETYPYVEWKDYINALLPEELKIDEDEVINLSVPSFYYELGNILESTDKRVIANYMMWRIHAHSVTFLPENFRKRQLQYSTVASGRKEEVARWKECANIVSGSLGISVGSLYVHQHFKEDSKGIALEMVNNIRNVFGEILDKVDWMDSNTKLKAKNKLDAMATYIGYPGELMDYNKLEEYYRDLEINPEKYLKSFLNMVIFHTNKSLNKFRSPVNKTEWTRHAYPAVVNAYYSPIENSIQFPAGILQGHFFNSQRPKYMNYGAIGYVIGHEITHGFDDQGRQFDVDGNLVDWWKPDTEKAYLEKAQCIINQYGNFTDKQTGLNLNGINTQGENIADNGGIKESYLAYNKWVSVNGIEPSLPGLNYTQNQMFWISAAQTWCAIYRKESLKNRITTGVHSPNEFRVLGSLMNMKDFSRDFHCPDNSPMNPVHKCEVW